MLIRLIDSNKQEVFFSANQIRAVLNSNANPLLCQVVTTVLTPQGFQSFEVLGDAASTACAINRALEGKNDLAQ